MKKLLSTYAIVFIFIIISTILYNNPKDEDEFKNGYDRANHNYKIKIDTLSKHFNLPKEYLMAVIVLESSGKKNVTPRFEKKVYEKLLLIKKGKLNKFENITKSDLSKFSKKEIKLLAYSYGPFQIMGYKSIFLNIPFDTLIGKNNLYWSVKWINITYGDYLRKKEYKHAFHIHNAGKEFPKNGKPFTHNPEYVKNGLIYMEYFSKTL
ncbi:MAG: hypothetical protein JXR51_00170 [Bacteroidales bacterium]|nr:hypothetical protein [Bacteroidales bacterium]MBN2755555.1 hypothetical protein [Bacteroidales bacterium]